GLAHARLGQVQAALADYAAAIGINSNCPSALFNRAAAYARLGSYALAVADYEQFLRVAVDDPLAGDAQARLAEVRRALVAARGQE
ncbi:tetratricopeptide repeat protein, partial [Planctomycetota bacterium]|nr:tetratricopeptide repeat protein [Planctomycetota bacterium]